MSTAPSVEPSPDSPVPPNVDPTTPPRKLAPQPATGTPIVAKISGTATFRTDQLERGSRFRDFATETTEKYVGPMEPKEFLDTFFGEEAFEGKSVPEVPWTDTLKEKFRMVHGIRVIGGKEKANTETSMYKPLAEAIEDCIDTNAFGYVQAQVHKDCSSLSNSPDTAPDGILYSTDRSKPRTSVSDSAFSDLIVEVKGPDKSKPFDDKPAKGDSFERDTISAVEIRGQFIAYAVAQFVNQFRTHLFMVCVHATHARFIRWDHAGAVISAEFAYSEENYLADFFFRYTRATPEARGIDTTVKMLEDGEVAGEVRKQLMLKKNAPVFEFKVWNDSKKSEALSYYGTTAFAGNDQSVTGRATRVFKVWDPREKRVVLLKDAWRVASADAEGKTYELLKENGVENVPTCLRAGDVNPGAANHLTRTHDYDPDYDPKTPSSWRKHQHYRLVLEEVCRGDLSMFNDVKELLSVMLDALIAHDQAYSKAEKLHRDISVGNILITKDGKGLLADWEVAKSISELANALQPERTGTWQFISGAILNELVPHATRVDDLESYFHVLGWIALQFIRHSKDPYIVEKDLKMAYDDVDKLQNKVKGGSQKIRYMGQAELAKTGFTPGPFADLIKDLEETFASRYAPDPNPQRLDIALKTLAKKDISAEERDFYMEHSDYRVYERRKRLESSEWIINRFKAAIASDKWSQPSLERHEIQLPGKNNTRKVTDRPAEVADEPPAKRPRLRTIRGISQQGVDTVPEHADEDD